MEVIFKNYFKLIALVFLVSQCSTSEYSENVSLDLETLNEITLKKNDISKEVLTKTAITMFSNYKDVYKDGNLSGHSYPDSIMNIYLSSILFKAYLDYALDGYKGIDDFVLTQEIYNRELEKYILSVNSTYKDSSVLKLLQDEKYNPFSYDDIQDRVYLIEELIGLVITISNLEIVESTSIISIRKEKETLYNNK